MRSRDAARRRKKIAGHIGNVWRGPVPAPNAAPEQQVSLLVPKLRPPHLPSPLVVRQRLLSQLDESLERKLSVLSAPAGSGKTTLISQWITRHQISTDSSQRPLRVAWVSLDNNDNDPFHFWRYVITACQALRADLGASALALLQSSQASWRPSLRQSSLDTALTTLLNELAQLSDQSVLVMEDYHVITTHRIHEMVASLIEHLPPTLHLVLIARSDPPLPLARWRAQGQLVELQAVDLRFSEDEMATFLQQMVPFRLSGDELQRLLARSEGWGVGLRLLALALQGQKSEQEIEQVLITFSGNHRHLLEYFVGEVLDVQPEPVQHFLLQTSILSRLTDSLCDAVTERSDSEQLLETVERSGLFLSPLDGSGLWYRYHALFAEAMQHEARRRLGEDVVHERYRRASHWYEQHAMLTDAVEAALRGAEFARAALLIESIIDGPSSLSFHEMSLLRDWLKQVPESVLLQHPILCLASVIVQVFTADRYPPAITAQMEERLQAAEHIWSLEENTVWSGRVIAFRALLAVWQGCSDEAASFARKALVCLPDEDYEWRSICSGAIGEEARLAGQFDVARQRFQDALSFCVMSNNYPGTRVFRLYLGDVSYGRGALHEAVELYRQVLKEAGGDLIDKARALLGLSQLSYEWNILADAEQEAQEVLDLAVRLFDVSLPVQATSVLARIHAAWGEIEQALHLLQTQFAHLQPIGVQFYHRELLMWQARLHLAASDFSAMQRWTATCAEGNETLPLLQREQEDLLLSRWLIVQEQTQDALAMLERLHYEARKAGRTRVLLEIQMVQIQAYEAQARRKEAQQLLLAVLSQTSSEGYLRLFLDEGETIGHLLRTMLPDIREKPLLTYALAIVDAFTQAHGHSSVSSPLQEPLSPQELRVLRLLAAGRTRQEIADELVVSLNTVKTHLKRIYHKLNVTSHERACEVARNLHLL